VTVQRIPPAAHPAGGLFFTRFNNPIFAAHGGTSIKGMIEMRIRYLAMSVATLTAMAATELSARADDMTPSSRPRCHRGSADCNARRATRERAAPVDRAQDH
jgi:hypothetical protein